MNDPIHTAQDPIVLDREGNEVFVPSSQESQNPFSPNIRVMRIGPLAGALIFLSLPVILFFGFAVVLGLLAVFAVIALLMKLARALR